MAQKEQCFIITPIGDDTDPIRRHIEGIIDAAIVPALGDKYEIVVAHKMGDLGSITKQVIDKVYHSKLVIANLTNRNPNVMYELALRHATGKPAIMIAERGTLLPSDIIMQRTIFYYNDAKGVLELRDELKKAVCTIDFEKTSGPIVDVLGDISHDADMLKKVAEKDSNSKEPLAYIMQRLDRIENSITLSAMHNESQSQVMIQNEPQSQAYWFSFRFDSYSGMNLDVIDWQKTHEINDTYPNATVNGISWSGNCSDGGEIEIRVEVEYPRPNAYALSGWLVRCLSDIGFSNVIYTGNTRTS